MDTTIEKAINELLNTELWSSNLYLSLQFYFEDEQLPIIASWLNLQNRKTMSRIRKINELLIQEKGTVHLQELVFPANQWESPMVAFDILLKHEQYICRQIQDFLTLAQNSGYPNLEALALNLYRSEMHISDFFFELLQIVTKEWKRRLPFEE